MNKLSKEWKKNHPERVKEYGKKYRIIHREQLRDHYRKYRERKKNGIN